MAGRLKGKVAVVTGAAPRGEGVGNGMATAGIEYYLPLFFDDTATVFDYLGPQALVALHGDLDAAFAHFWQDTHERHRLVRGDPERPVLPPASLF